MNEALKKGISDRRTIASMESKNRLQKNEFDKNAISIAFNGASEIATSAMNTYAQSEMRKYAPELEKGLQSLADEYVDVNDTDAYKKYTEARTNYIDNYLKDKGVFFTSIFDQQYRAKYEDAAYKYFDDKFTNMIYEKNKANAVEIMTNSIKSFVNGEDMSLYENNYIYKTIVGEDGIQVVQDAVKLDNLWDTDTDDEKVNDFNRLLNIQYSAAALTMDMESAKRYITENIPSIESSVITNEILSMANNLVEESNLSEAQIAKKIMDMYGDGRGESNYRTPYTNRVFTPEEATSYRDIAQKAVANEWSAKEDYFIDIYNEKFIPALEAIEATGEYITSDVFNRLIDSEEIGIDRRFVKATLSKWDSLLQTNDAMYALDDWFKNGQPMDDSLTSFMNNFVYKDSDSNKWMYTNSAGFITMSGFTDKTLQQNMNRQIEDNNIKVGEQMLNNYYDLMVATTDFALGNANDDNPIQREYIARTEGKNLTDEEMVRIKNDVQFDFMSSAYTQYWKGKNLGANSSEIDSKLSAYRSTYTAGAEEIEAMNKAKKEQEREQEATRLGLYNSALNSEALAIEDSDGIYTRNMETSYGKNIVLGRALNNTYTSLKESGADLSSIFDSYVEDPLAKGLTDEQIKTVKEYANDNDIPYVYALLDLGYYNNKDYYTLGYEVLSKLVSLESGVSDVTSLEAYVQKRCLDTRYLWQQDYALRCNDYENAVGVYNGNLTPVYLSDSVERKAESLGLNKGNIDITNRFDKAQNDDGSYSTVNTISIGVDGKEVLIPTTWDGKNHTEEEAIARYEETGLHFGKFDTVDEANAYAENLHDFEEWKSEDRNVYEYVSTKPSSSSKSSSSTNTLNTYGGAKGRLDNAKTAMEEEAKYNAQPNEPIAGVLEGLFSLFGTENENGHIVTMEDIRMLARSNVLTEEQKKMVNTISTTELGNLLFEGNRFNRLMDAIDNDGFSELKKEQYLLAAIEYLDKNNADTTNIDKLCEEVVDMITNASWRDFVNALTEKSDDFSALFSTASGELKTDLLGLVSNYANARVGGTDDHAYYLGYYNRADEVINQGLSTSFSDILPDDFVALWASDDLVEIWSDENKVLKACLEAGFYFIGKESMFNSDTNIDAALDEWRSMFDENGNFKYTDASKEMAGTLYDAFQFAGQFYQIARAFRTLNDSNLNIGTVESVSNNTFKMSTGVTVKVRLSNSGKPIYEVWNKNGTACENINSFFSNEYLEGVSNGYSNALNDRQDYYITARIAEGNEQPQGGYKSAEDAKNTMADSYSKLWQFAKEYSSNINFSDNNKITDGQADAGWAEEWGYKAPQLFTGWSMNGYRYNYRITTDSTITFESEPPKTIGLAEAIWEGYKMLNSPTPAPEYATLNGIQLTGNLVSFGGI